MIQRATVSPRDVLEALLGAHVIVGIEAVELLDQQFVGQPISISPHIPSWADGPPSQLQQRLAGEGGQQPRRRPRCSAVRSVATTPHLV